jgi:mono/diheme cytochrome c family protein
VRPWPQRKACGPPARRLVIGGIGLIAGLLGWRSAIAPVSLTAPVYSEATIERGRVLAALGDCAVCHTAPGGAPNAGGRAMETPFGTLYTTNLTPDAETGLGRWSFSAFQRAMREGVSRDGHHLYPAFPYTAFAKTSDDDLQALYAYFMSMPAVRAETPKAELKFPFSIRPLMAGWNALFNDPAPLPPVATQSAEWNRGAYLVNGLGHCGACHTPRNALGAEQGGSAFLSGAMIDGWEAPALTGLSKSAVPWDADELYRYLRQGHAQRHGIAGGPMAEVVRELAQVPDADVRAMATYLASFNPAPAAEPQAVAQQVVDTAARTQGRLLGPAQRMFDSACASCHHDGDGPTLLGVNTPLALNSNLASARPDNLLRTILDGVREPASRDIGFMPAFREALDDRQIAELAGYMRARFAPLRILGGPDAGQPSVELAAEDRVGDVVALREVGRDRHFARPHDDACRAAAEKVPEARHAVGVDDGHVDQRLEFGAHRFERQCERAGLGFEQVAVGRALRLVLVGSEARPLGEVHHAGGNQRELLAGASRGLAVLAAQRGVFAQVGLRMARHEGEVERPPGQADHRHVDELLLEEELQHRDAAVHRVLQHEDVDPRLVVGVHQIPAAVGQRVDALYVPLRALGEPHPAAVAGDPGSGHAVEHRVDASAHGGEGQHQLHQREQEDQAAPEQGVDDEQQEGDDAADDGGQETEHGTGGAARARVSAKTAIVRTRWPGLSVPDQGGAESLRQARVGPARYRCVARPARPVRPSELQSRDNTMTLSLSASSSLPHDAAQATLVGRLWQPDVEPSPGCSRPVTCRR